MTEFIYAVVDNKSPNFTNIFKAANDELAKRHFTALMMQRDSQFQMFPQDFYLVQLASFDDIKGTFTNVDHVVPIYLGTEVSDAVKATADAFRADSDLMDRLFSYENSQQLSVHASASEALKHGNAVSSFPHKAQAASQDGEECKAKAGESEEEN